jgi:hypothetical protein
MVNFRLFFGCWALLQAISIPLACGQQTFAPPAERVKIYALKTAFPIQIDGQLNEPVWNEAEPYFGFTQREPVQGNVASHDTEVRVVYDEHFLYIAAINKEDLSRKSNVRVLNMQRDFEAYQNDRFGVAIDGFMDGQNAIGFEVTPFGAQRDVQVQDGEERAANRNWDGLWFAKTSLTDTTWIAEIAIPWKTMRYPANAKEMLISFTRNIRRDNEVTTFPTFPRAFSHFRMAYAAVLTDVEPPPPSANLQLNPYLLSTAQRNGTDKSLNNPVVKAGGEIKWAPSPNTIIDATFLTDFAQADVDLQVQNLSRFSVLFPERRQFFLENANIFKTSISTFIQPFFSRKIGLDEAGNPIPIDGGIRLTSQTSRQTVGLLVMRQRAQGESPEAHFLVGRYVNNFAGQNRLGAMVTHRADGNKLGNGQITSAERNSTATLNTFLRPNQAVSIETMVSASTDSKMGNGLAAHTWVAQEKNWGYVGFVGQFVSENYIPGAGFLAFENYALVSPAVNLDLRPSWLPAWIRSYGPNFLVDVYWQASDFSFQQAFADVAFIDFEFEKGGDFEIRVKPEWQQIFNEFNPLGLSIAPGFYQFNRFTTKLSTDASKKLSGRIDYETGGYYNGTLTSWQANLRISPLPHIELTPAYRYNMIRKVGSELADLDAQLLILNTRLALNPRAQCNINYQWNSVTEGHAWNIRMSWEYRPLSFIYLVFNSRAFREEAFPERRQLFQDTIGKVTYLKQF